jgi:Protein of unknown function (DUF664)
MRHVTGAERSFFRRSYGRQDIPSLYAPPGRPDADFEEADPAHAARDLERLVTSSSRSGAVPPCQARHPAGRRAQSLAG